MSKDKSAETATPETVLVNYQNVDELFPLGREYIDLVTGLKGTATARQIHHNGCITFTVEPTLKVKKKQGVKNQVVNVVRMGGSPHLLPGTVIEVDDTVKHPLLDAIVKNDYTQIEGLVTLVNRTIEGFDHVYVLPPGNAGGKPKDLVEFSVKEIGVKLGDEWLAPNVYAERTNPQPQAEAPVSHRPSPVNMDKVHRKFPH